MVTPKTPSPNNCSGSGACQQGDSKNLDAAAAAFMGVSLVGARFGANEVTYSMIQDYCKKACCERIIFVIDTGSEAYFVQDDTGCPEGGNSGEALDQFLKTFKLDALLDEPTLGMSLTFGDMGTGVATSSSAKTFKLEHPTEWFMAKPTTVAQVPAPANAKDRTQTIIGGNFWLQGIAVTWTCHPSQYTIAFSHLDKDGNRCETYKGPPISNPTKKQETLSRLAALPEAPRSCAISLAPFPPIAFF